MIVYSVVCTICSQFTGKLATLLWYSSLCWRRQFTLGEKISHALLKILRVASVHSKILSVASVHLAEIPEQVYISEREYFVVLTCDPEDFRDCTRPLFLQTCSGDASGANFTNSVRICCL